MELFTAVERGDLVKTQSLLESEFSDARTDIINSYNPSGMTLLHIASQKGHLDLVKYLIDLGAEVSKPSHEGDTALNCASRNGHLGVVQCLVTKGSKLETGNMTRLFVASGDGDTPLLTALRMGHYEIAKYFIAEGADPNKADRAGQTPLCIASQKGHIGVLRFLVNAGADVNKASNEGHTPLLAASRKGHQDITKYLIAKRADPNMADSAGQTPLYIASQKGHLCVVKALVNARADVNKTTKGGNTPLLAAVRMGYHEIAKYLITKKADFDMADREGQTPLYIASQKGYLRVVEILVNAGADVNKASKDGDTPLLAASSNGHVGIVKYFIAKGANPDVTDSSNQTSLYIASQKGHLDIVESLLNTGADVNKRSKDGDTPLFTALRMGHHEIAEYLVTKKADPDVVDRSSRTPLYIASQKGYLGVVESLVNAGADVSKASNDGDTPLLAASSEGRQDIVKYLITKGADPNVADRAGETPLYIASQRGHFRVVTYLVNAGADVNKASNDGNTPLLAASSNGHLGIVKHLISIGTRLDFASNKGDTSFSLALKKGHLGIAEYLAIAGADVNKAPLVRSASLHTASRHGYINVLKYLIRRSSDVDKMDELGFTTLHYAAQNGHLGIVKCLLDAGADVNIASNTCNSESQFAAERATADMLNINGFSPLHLASQAGHLDIVEYLVQAGADVNKASSSDNAPQGTSHEGFSGHYGSEPAKPNKGIMPLHLASQASHLNVVKFLLNAGADVNKASNDGDTPLLAASSNGHLGIVKYLVSNGATLDFANNEGETSFSLALKKGHLGIAEYLAIAGADVNKAPLVSRASVHAASRHGYINVVKYLIRRSSDVDMMDELGFTTLHYAAQNGHLSIVKCLLDAGADVNSVSSSDRVKGITPLHRTSQAGHLNIVEYPIQAGADVNKASSSDNPSRDSRQYGNFVWPLRPKWSKRGNIEGITPLHLASYAGHHSIVEYLVQAGADVNKASSSDNPSRDSRQYGNYVWPLRPKWSKRGNIEGTSPLHLASYAGHLNIVEYLVQEGAYVNQASFDGTMPLHAALNTRLLDKSSNLRRNLLGLDVGMIECFIDIPSFHSALPEEQFGIGEPFANFERDVEKASSTIQTHTPSNKSYLDIVRYLVTKGAEVDRSNRFGVTPLQLASHAGHFGAVECLVNAGADINKASKYGDMSSNLLPHWDTYTMLGPEDNYPQKPPLYIASEEGHLGIVQYLLKSGADVNLATENGYTPLHCASNGNHLDVVKYLTTRGANLNARNKDGITPLHAASLKGNLKIVEYLVDAGADVDTVSIHGEGPLQAASRMGHHEVVQYLSEVCRKTSSPTSQGGFHRSPSQSVFDPEDCFVKGIFTSEGGELSIPSHGFNLSIPRGALDSSQEISLQPVFDLPSGIDFNQDEIVASLGFKCQPSGIIFEKPVKLTIPHCALISDPERVKCILYTEGKDGSCVRSEATEFKPHHGKMDIFLDHFCDVHPVLEGNGVLGKVMLCTPFLPKASLEKEKPTIVHLSFYTDDDRVKDRVFNQESSLQYRAAFPEQELIINRDPQDDRDPHTTVVQCTVKNSTFTEEKTVPNKTLLHHRWQTVSCCPKPPESDSIIVIKLLPHDKEMALSPRYTEKPLAMISPSSSTPHSTTPGSGASSADAHEVTDAHVIKLSKLLRSDHFSAMYDALGITHADADNIRTRHRENYPAIYVDLLQKWKTKSVRTLEDLDEVLRQAELDGLISRYKKK